MEKPPPTRAELIIMIAGAVMFVGSFVNFYSGGRSTAWSTGMFPIATLLPLYGVIMGGQIALTKFTATSLPATIASFTWEQIQLALGIFAAVLAVAFFMVENAGLSAGIFIELLAAAGLVAGAVMLQQERATGALG